MPIHTNGYYGDIRLGDTIDIKFTSVSPGPSSVPTTLGGSPVISAYVGNTTSAITSGITLTTDFNSLTGYNNVRVVASAGNTFATATNVDLVVSTGTIAGVSAVGESVGSFSIENRSALMPTTAARTLDVTATGAAGIDWGNVENQSTTVTLSFTTILTATAITALLPTALVGGRMDSSVGAYQSGLTPLQPTVTGRTLDVTLAGEAGIDWANIGSPSTTQTLSATTIAAVSGAVGSVTGAVGSVAGNVGGNVVGSVGSVTGNVGGTTGDYTTILAIKAKTDNLPEGYKKGVGFDLVFFMAASGVPVTGLTDANFSKKDLVQDTSAPAALSGTITEIGDGYYTVALTNTEANATQLSFSFLATGTGTTAFTLKASP